MQNLRFIDSYAEDIISQLAQDEAGKRQYYRPVYSLHKWWARRPGALFRSIILLATNSDKGLFLSDADGSISILSDYFKGHNLENAVIFDPFMGGGTTLVEANRLGAKVIGCDLNPVSYWIVKETLKPIDLDRLDMYFHELESDAGKKIKALYHTRCANCGSQCDSLYGFWVRYVKCSHCSENAYLFKRTLLNEGLSRNKPPSPSNPATAFCPHCFALNDWHGSGHCTCRSCNHHFDPQIGTYNQGFYTCLHCGQSHIQLLQTLRSGQKLREKLITIEYYCDCCRDRIYKSPDAKDLANLDQIERSFEERKNSLIFPRQRILEGASSVRWRLHNYQCYYEVFNARQLVAFNYLLESIQAIPEEEYRNALITVFSNSLEYNNMMTPYNYPHRKLHHLFNYHALPLTTTPVENVVWGAGREGAGTFANCYQRYVLAKKYCQSPFDKFKDSFGVVQTMPAKGEEISARFVQSFDELNRTPRSAFLLCQDSSQLPAVPDQTADFVITDPPYFDNIHYSELSNFFYVWLNQLVDHPYFVTQNVPTQQEAIVNGGMNKGEEDYRNLLTAVFRESGRILKDGGKLIFTFHHTKWRAWWTVLTAIINSGFRVVDSFPVLSEYKVNPHIRNKQSLDMDLVLICEKRVVHQEPLSTSPTEILQRAMTPQIKNSHSNGNKLFLYFMGELLKTASSTTDNKRVDFDWFENALVHFDDFLATENISTNKIRYEISKPRQLRLLDGKSSKQSQ